MNANEPLPDQSLADAVVDRLRAAISSGMYAPGERLVERRLAHEFGISHIPLREALARLTEEGLVVRLPRRGARVASLTPRMLEEVSSLRVVLEQFVVRRLKGRFTPDAQRGSRRSSTRCCSPPTSTSSSACTNSTSSSTSGCGS